MAAYPGMKPMLDFIRVPEAIESRPRRRRCAVKTPKNPKVKAVPLGSENQQPCIKWVSPQFDVVETRACVRRRAQRAALEMKTNKRVVQPLQLEEEDSPCISICPSLAPCLINQRDKNIEQNDQITALSQNVSTDQTVPDLKDSEDTQQTMDDSDATTEDLPVKDLSALVGTMSLEETTDSPLETEPFPTDNANDSCPLEEPVQSNMSGFSMQSIEDKHSYFKSTQIEQNNATQLSKAINQIWKPSTCPYKEQPTSVFQPPSASTPCRHSNGDTLPPSTATSTKQCEEWSSLPDSNFVLCLTETTDNQSEDEQLDDHERSSDLDFILAVETPQHLWHSPEVRVIDSTFS